MRCLTPTMSALPRKTDLKIGGHRLPLMTQSGHGFIPLTHISDCASLRAINDCLKKVLCACGLWGHDDALRLLRVRNYGEEAKHQAFKSPERDYHQLHQHPLEGCQDLPRLRKRGVVTGGACCHSPCPKSRGYSGLWNHLSYGDDYLHQLWAEQW